MIADDWFLVLSNYPITQSILRRLSTLTIEKDRDKVDFATTLRSSQFILIQVVKISYLGSIRWLLCSSRLSSARFFARVFSSLFSNWKMFTFSITTKR